MRSYEKEQKDSVMFQGEQAGKIVETRKAMDKEAEEICGRLHDAFNLAEEEFKQLGLRYEPQFVAALKGTELESVPLERIGFDFTSAEKHGVVFAREIEKNPIAAFLELLRKTTESGPSVGDDDRIYVESIGEKKSDYSPDIARSWSQRENA